MNFLCAALGLALLSLRVQLTLTRVLELESSAGEAFGDGRWSSWEKCPQHSYVVGLSVQSGTSGNLRFYCTRPQVVSEARKTSYFEINVTQATGQEEKWTDPIFCERGIVTGFQILSTPAQSETSFVSNVALICSDKALLFFDEETAAGLWSTPQRCGAQEAICGSQGQIQTIGNETSLQTLRMDCCEIPHPASTCEATDKLHLIGECSNADAVLPLTCTLDKSLGLTYSGKEGETGIYEDLGFDIASAAHFLAAQPDFQLVNGDFDFFHDVSWAPAVTSKETITAQPGEKVSLRQMIGFCGLYKIYTPFLQRKTERISSKEERHQRQKAHKEGKVKDFLDVEGMQGDEGWDDDEDDFDKSEENEKEQLETKGTKTETQDSSDTNQDSNKDKKQKSDDEAWSDEINDEKSHPTNHSPKLKEPSKDDEADVWSNEDEDEKLINSQPTVIKPAVEQIKTFDFAETSKESENDWKSEENVEVKVETTTTTQSKLNDKEKDTKALEKNNSEEGDDWNSDEKLEVKVDPITQNTHSESKEQKNKDSAMQRDDSEENDWDNEEKPEVKVDQNTENTHSESKEQKNKDSAMQRDDSEENDWDNEEKVEVKVDPITQNTHSESKEQKNKDSAMQTDDSEENGWNSGEKVEVKAEPTTTLSKSNDQEIDTKALEKNNSEEDNWNSDEKPEVKVVPTTPITQSESKEQKKKDSAMQTDDSEENDWNSGEKVETKAETPAIAQSNLNKEEKNNKALETNNSEEDGWNYDKKPEVLLVPTTPITQSELSEKENKDSAVQKDSSEENGWNSDEKVEVKVEATTTSTQSKSNEEMRVNSSLEKKNPEEDYRNVDVVDKQIDVETKSEEVKGQSLENASAEILPEVAAEATNDSRWTKEVSEDEPAVATSPGAAAVLENSNLTESMTQDTHDEKQNSKLSMMPPAVEKDDEKKTNEWDDDSQEHHEDLESKESDQLFEKVETPEASLEVELVDQIPTETKPLNGNLSTVSGDGKEEWIDTEDETKEDAPIHFRIPILSPGGSEHHDMSDEDSSEDLEWGKSAEEGKGRESMTPAKVNDPHAHASNEDFPDPEIEAEIEAETMGKREGSLQTETNQSEPIVGKSYGLLDLDSLHAGAKELGDQISKEVSALTVEAKKILDEVKEMPVVVEVQKTVEDSVKTAVETVFGLKEEVERSGKSDLVAEDGAVLVEERASGTETPVHQAGGFVGYIVGGMVLCVVVIVIVIFVIEKRSLKGKEEESRLKAKYKDELNPAPEPLLKEERIDMEEKTEDV